MKLNINLSQLLEPLLVIQLVSHLLLKLFFSFAFLFLKLLFLLLHFEIKLLLLLLKPLHGLFTIGTCINELLLLFRKFFLLGLPFVVKALTGFFNFTLFVLLLFANLLLHLLHLLVIILIIDLELGELFTIGLLHCHVPIKFGI